MSDVAALFFNAEIMAKTAGFLLDGLWMTVLLCLVVIPVGALGGKGWKRPARRRRYSRGGAPKWNAPSRQRTNMYSANAMPSAGQPTNEKRIAVEPSNR